MLLGQQELGVGAASYKNVQTHQTLLSLQKGRLQLQQLILLAQAESSSTQRIDKSLQTTGSLRGGPQTRVGELSTLSLLCGGAAAPASSSSLATSPPRDPGKFSAAGRQGAGHGKPWFPCLCGCLFIWRFYSAGFTHFQLELFFNELYNEA